MASRDGGDKIKLVNLIAAQKSEKAEELKQDIFIENSEVELSPSSLSLDTK